MASTAEQKAASCLGGAYDAEPSYFNSTSNIEMSVKTQKLSQHALLTSRVDSMEHIDKPINPVGAISKMSVPALLASLHENVDPYTDLRDARLGPLETPLRLKGGGGVNSQCYN